MSLKETSDVISRVARVEKLLGSDASELIARQDLSGIATLISQAGVSKASVRDCKAALNRYAIFKGSMR